MTAIRDAATIIVLRDDAVLMGQRGASAAFMPNKFVFPGGAVDAADSTVPTTGLTTTVAEQLATESELSPSCLASAAIRELWEETGQILGFPRPWNDAPMGWRGFAQTGHIPHASRLQFFFRAVTPQGRPRRFDARFLLADAVDLVTNPDDFSGAEDELSHLQWVPLDRARTFDLPFITQVVLAELRKHIADPQPLTDIPFFRNDDEAHLVTRLAGASLL